MQLKLSDDLRQALASEGTPLRLIDPSTGETFLVVRESDVASELGDTYRAQFQSAMRAGWDDPAMDDYNGYDR